VEGKFPLGLTVYNEGKQMSVSVLILTLNEEINLPQCLNLVSWSDDIVVFDSYSSDRTVEIAKAAGARVVQRKFDNYAAQRNAALCGVEYKNQWVLMVDADECWPKEIYAEIKTAIESDKKNEFAVYHFRRKDMFMGKWLKRSSGYPTWAGRLVQLGRVSVERKINEEYQSNGRKGYLKSHFIHYPFHRGLDYWFERHNRYSSMEAEASMEDVQHNLRFKDFFSSDPTTRRKFLKQLAYRLPCRPLLAFCYLYFFKMGFLDGIPGLTYCRLRKMYEYMIDLKVKELQDGKKAADLTVI
jgi:glycosyltransferase involved in cell wall biosynthesis